MTSGVAMTSGVTRGVGRPVWAAASSKSLKGKALARQLAAVRLLTAAVCARIKKADDMRLPLSRGLREENTNPYRCQMQISDSSSVHLVM